MARVWYQPQTASCNLAHRRYLFDNQTIRRKEVTASVLPERRDGWRWFHKLPTWFVWDCQSPKYKWEGKCPLLQKNINQFHHIIKTKTKEKWSCVSRKGENWTEDHLLLRSYQVLPDTIIRLLHFLLRISLLQPGSVLIHRCKTKAIWRLYILSRENLPRRIDDGQLCFV